MENKQSTVEWLIEQLEKERLIRTDLKTTLTLIVNKAKVMEEERLIQKYGEGYGDGILYDSEND